MLDDIEKYLISKGVATVTGIDIFKGGLPEEPDDCISLQQYGGEPPDTLGYEKPGLQIFVRSASYLAAKAKAKKIDKALHCLTNITLDSGERYLSFFAQQSPYAFDRDSYNRQVFVQNYIVTKER